MSYAYTPPSNLSTSPTSFTNAPQCSASFPHEKFAHSCATASNSRDSTKKPPSPLSIRSDVPDLSSSTVPAPTDLPPSPLTEPRAWFTYPISYAANSVYRRISSPPDPRLTGLLQAPGAARPRYPSPGRGHTPDMMIFSRSRSRQRQTEGPPPALDPSGTQQAPLRKASPFQPPPLAPLHLHGFRASTPEKDRILSKSLAEEIRLLVPPRLQLETDWRLCYSVEQDGASLATLYNRCDGVEEGCTRSGFVLVVRDAVGGIFGAFLTDPPKPRSSYYGTGECFLWSATIQTIDKMLAHLPPPPSEDTTHMESRSTTIVSPVRTSFGDGSIDAGLISNGASVKKSSQASSTSGVELQAEEEERIRFRAYPYSGVNDYMIFCEQGYLSVGGGDGKYGLWLDDQLEQGISSPSLTFGNEGLSEEGEKFEALGVEVWFIGG